jgi:hypothetical protein
MLFSKMIAQHQIDASRRRTITDFTTQSAFMNSAQGDKPCAAAPSAAASTTLLSIFGPNVA